ncbi:hypothetical protein O3P69_017497 [Scylla paramamosain]|uniref:Ig-like domain-containing protein n=1 Tax=Scylla paramamosain TaxID=85552 RepID=A0AAW0TVX2_SCYPA
MKMKARVSAPQVSWIRHRDLHVLTVGSFTFTNDARFSAYRDQNTGDWVLVLRNPEPSDSGLYECSISTKPVTAITVKLQVVVPTVELLGGGAVYLDRGSTLNLTCMVHFSPTPPDFILWYHRDKLVNYGQPGRNISVKTEHFEDTTRSSLLVENATTWDSGVYSCKPSNAKRASIKVHVLTSETPAAMQTTTSGCQLVKDDDVDSGDSVDADTLKEMVAGALVWKQAGSKPELNTRQAEAEAREVSGKKQQGGNISSSECSRSNGSRGSLERKGVAEGRWAGRQVGVVGGQGGAADPRKAWWTMANVQYATKLFKIYETLMSREAAGKCVWNGGGAGRGEAEARRGRGRGEAGRYTRHAQKRTAITTTTIAASIAANTARSNCTTTTTTAASTDSTASRIKNVGDLAAASPHRWLQSDIQGALQLLPIPLTRILKQHEGLVSLLIRAGVHEKRGEVSVTATVLETAVAAAVTQCNLRRTTSRARRTEDKWLVHLCLSLQEVIGSYCTSSLRLVVSCVPLHLFHLHLLHFLHLGASNGQAPPANAKVLNRLVAVTFSFFLSLV